jgi:RHS repeat-associated protein
MVAATTLSKKSLALERQHRRAHVGAKSRVGVSELGGTARVGARARRSSEAHQEKAARVRRNASARAVYYNHHRWFDPATGRYLSSEPMLQSPEFALSAAVQLGRNPPTYAYALNNPLRYIDPHGLQGWEEALAGAAAFCALRPDLCQRISQAAAAAVAVAATAAAAAVCAAQTRTKTCDPDFSERLPDKTICHYKCRGGGTWQTTEPPGADCSKPITVPVH